MSSPATVNMESMLSDFSTSLLDSKGVDKKSKEANGRMEDEFQDDKTMAGNFNLNSVLTKIRDNGSAYIDSKRRDDVKNSNPAQVVQTPKNNNHDSDTTQNQTEYMNDEIADDELHLSSTKAVDIKLLNYISRTHLLTFTGVTAMIIGVSMYMLDSHVDNSIHAMTQNVDATVPVVMKDMNEKMEGAVLRRPDQIMLSEITTTDTNELTMISSNISELKNEIHSLRKELDQVKVSITSGKGTDTTLHNSIKPAESIVAAEPENMTINESIAKVVSENSSTLAKTNSKSAVASINKTSSINNRKTLNLVEKRGDLPSFIVGLVSLSNKNKAKEIITSLDMTGLSPHIKEVTINGKQIYRVSVSGFNNKKIAAEFIQNAANKFGIKGSRIRKY